MQAACTLLPTDQTRLLQAFRKPATKQLICFVMMDQANETSKIAYSIFVSLPSKCQGSLYYHFVSHT